MYFYLDFVETVRSWGAARNMECKTLSPLGSCLISDGTFDWGRRMERQVIVFEEHWQSEVEEIAQSKSFNRLRKGLKA